jgi:hypothetical protein
VPRIRAVSWEPWRRERSSLFRQEGNLGEPIRSAWNCAAICCWHTDGEVGARARGTRQTSARRWGQVSRRCSALPPRRHPCPPPQSPTDHASLTDDWVVASVPGRGRQHFFSLSFPDRLLGYQYSILLPSQEIAIHEQTHFFPILIWKGQEIALLARCQRRIRFALKQPPVPPESIERPKARSDQSFYQKEKENRRGKRNKLKEEDAVATSLSTQSKIDPPHHLQSIITSPAKLARLPLNRCAPLYPKQWLIPAAKRVDLLQK